MNALVLHGLCGTVSSTKQHVTVSWRITVDYRQGGAGPGAGWDSGYGLPALNYDSFGIRAGPVSFTQMIGFAPLSRRNRGPIYTCICICNFVGHLVKHAHSNNSVQLSQKWSVFLLLSSFLISNSSVATSAQTAHPTGATVGLGICRFQQIMRVEWG